MILALEAHPGSPESAVVDRDYSLGSWGRFINFIGKRGRGALIHQECVVILAADTSEAGRSLLDWTG